MARLAGFGAPKKSAAGSSRKKGARQDALPVWEADKKACPCGSGRPYTDCCEPYHNGGLEPTAESLMRARFSAYVKGKVLLRHPMLSTMWHLYADISLHECLLIYPCNSVLAVRLQLPQS